MPPDPRTPAQRLIVTLETLRRAVAENGKRRGIAGALVMLIWVRLGRTILRVARLAALQGKPFRPRGPRTPTVRPPRPKPQLRLPQGRLWLIRLIQETAFGASQLRHLLAQPETAAWIAETPQSGRVLRPLCRMLGVDPPPSIARPPPRPAAPPAPAPAATQEAPRRTAAGPAPTAAPPAAPPLPPRRAAPRRLARPTICGPPAPA